ncbi:histone deacetylase family protein [Herbidospora galbida]|uniref:Histone deacetylase family protein n=1 Tax=Herbidospora galbida TaxID=2575442 RepID=A0A4U3MCN5_9ACTN|nr:histone deacetylase family protein [Herbidospora galbida]TKK86430.1 histone deacetylase family protein [Herbidospora galbida]
MIGVWSPATLRHDPSAEIWIGLRTPGTEVAERVRRIQENVPLTWVDADEVPWDVLTSVHAEGMLRHLRDVYAEWVAAGYPQDRVVPYVFPTPAMLGGMPGRVPAAVHGRAGLYAYDTMTLVGPGTWEAALAAAGAAWTAARRVSGGPAYALCRPPGHHATRDGYGGSCYLNNAAVAAATLRGEGYAKVAVIDVDAHHGNGTQAIFWDRDDVFYGSVHVDPGAGWFPHYVGFADETGGGTTLNVPVAPESGDAVWLAGVTRLCEAAARFGAEALVVSLGVDAAADDPESPLRISREGYFETGRLLGGLGLPTVAVQEGGYHLETLGPLVAATLRGIQSPS